MALAVKMGLTATAIPLTVGQCLWMVNTTTLGIYLPQQPLRASREAVAVLAGVTIIPLARVAAAAAAGLWLLLHLGS